jgi:5'-nucleotidase
LKKRKLVMVTNDDSVRSKGLIELARAISKYARVEIVAPEQPQSATALSLTFHKPLRVTELFISGMKCYAVSGTPGDCVMIGVNKILPRKPDLIASGINFGDNVTYQDILASGTVAAALAGALARIPSVSFSMEVPEENIFSLEPGRVNFRSAAEIAAEIVNDVLLNGMPYGAEVLNVNFPGDINRMTGLSITRIARRKYKDKVIVRLDPRKRPYYWLFGERLRSFPKDSDAFAVHEMRMISISPIKLRMTGKITGSLHQLGERVGKRIREKFG